MNAWDNVTRRCIRCVHSSRCVCISNVYMICSVLRVCDQGSSAWCKLRRYDRAQRAKRFDILLTASERDKILLHQHVHRERQREKETWCLLGNASSVSERSHRERVKDEHHKAKRLKPHQHIEITQEKPESLYCGAAQSAHHWGLEDTCGPN